MNRGQRSNLNQISQNRRIRMYNYNETINPSTFLNGEGFTSICALFTEYLSEQSPHTTHRSAPGKISWLSRISGIPRGVLVKTSRDVNSHLITTKKWHPPDVRSVLGQRMWRSPNTDLISGQYAVPAHDVSVSHEIKMTLAPGHRERIWRFLLTAPRDLKTNSQKLVHLPETC